MRSSTQHLGEDVYNFLGHTIGIRSNAPEILDHFSSVYGRMYLGSTGPAGHQESEVSRGPRPLIEAIYGKSDSSSDELLLSDDSNSYRFRCRDLNGCDPGRLLPGTPPDAIFFTNWLFLTNVFRMITDCWQLIHAGAVSWGEQAVIFPGESGMGKTTLTLKLVQKGCRFLSDEYACLGSEQGLVEPFCRKLNVSDSSRRLLGLPELPEREGRITESGEMEWAVDIEEVIPSSISGACPLRYIFFLQGFSERPRLAPISASAALLRLFKFSMNPATDPGMLLMRFAPALDKARSFDLVAGDLGQTADLILNLLDGAGQQD